MGFTRTINFSEDLIVAFEKLGLFDEKGEFSAYVDDACRERLIRDGYLEEEE